MAQTVRSEVAEVRGGGGLKLFCFVDNKCVAHFLEICERLSTAVELFDGFWLVVNNMCRYSMGNFCLSTPKCHLKSLSPHWFPQSTINLENLGKWAIKSTDA